MPWRLNTRFEITDVFLPISSSPCKRQTNPRQITHSDTTSHFQTTADQNNIRRSSDHVTVNDVFEFEDAAAELRLLVLASARPHVAAVAVGNNHWHCSCPIVAYDTYIRGGQEVKVSLAPPRSFPLN